MYKKIKVKTSYLPNELSAYLIDNDTVIFDDGQSITLSNVFKNNGKYHAKRLIDLCDSSDEYTVLDILKVIKTKTIYELLYTTILKRDRSGFDYPDSVDKVFYEINLLL